MKKVYRIAAALVAVLALISIGAVFYVRSSSPDYGRDARIPGLAGPVEVWRDSLAVPHIWAESEADLLRALGYVHAQERLWQMEMFRRVADGRLAEILGPGLVDSDRFLRTLGMGRAAAITVRRLDPAHRALLDAYAQGVNAWIADHPGALPPEFVALRFRPEPWTIRNSVSIGKLMAWDLADWTVGLELQRAVDIVGPELAADLAPGYPAWGTTILTGAAPAEGGGTRRKDRASRVQRVTGRRVIPRRRASAPRPPHLPIARWRDSACRCRACRNPHAGSSTSRL